MIELKNVSCVYSENGPFETVAVRDISLKIEKGGFYGLIGHTGSGKTTLVQLMSGLLKPTSGEIWLDGVNIADKKIKTKDVVGKTGLVFQYPEYQLFEETVFDDVAFGPRNMGLCEEEVKKRVISALDTVGISQKIYQKSPFELSGGQKRRVAIAGILSMEPEVLILDEPTAGLDPGGRDDILGEISKLHREKGITVILVSHSMEDVAKVCEKVIVINGGQIEMCASTGEVFAESEILSKMGLSIPQISKIVSSLREKGINLPDNILTVDDAEKAIISLLGGGEND